MSAQRVGRCFGCDLELPFVALSRGQQNKLRARKPAACIGCCDNRPSPEELENGGGAKPVRLKAGYIGSIKVEGLAGRAHLAQRAP